MIKTGIEMEQKVSEIIKNQFPQLTIREVLENYSHIELTEEEEAEGLLWAKRKKEDALKQASKKEREAQNRKKFLQTTNYQLVKSLMLYRMDSKFEGRFILDEHNTLVFEMLCRYFGNDDEFNSMCKSIGMENTSLDKGIFLAGNFGVGKTWIMKLFMQNQRQCYALKNAKEIADEFEMSGEEMTDYVSLAQNALGDPSVFHQRNLGLCIDDIGTEDIKINYGNKKNVVGDIIEKRYIQNNFGTYLHGTTNFTAQQLNEFYGGRVVSRMREIFNFIELRGSDRRK